VGSLRCNAANHCRRFGFVSTAADTNTGVLQGYYVHRNLSTKVVAILNTTSSWRRIQHYQEASAAFEHKVRDSGLQVHWAQRPTDLHWAWVTVHSRSMKVFIPRNPNHPLHAKPFLAPGADFLNHEPAVQVEWQLRKGKSNESMLHIATQQAYPRAGLEVFNQYAVSVSKFQSL